MFSDPRPSQTGTDSVLDVLALGRPFEIRTRGVRLVPVFMIHDMGLCWSAADEGAGNEAVDLKSLRAVVDAERDARIAVFVEVPLKRASDARPVALRHAPNVAEVAHRVVRLVVNDRTPFLTRQSSQRERGQTLVRLRWLRSIIKLALQTLQFGLRPLVAGRPYWRIDEVASRLSTFGVENFTILRAVVGQVRAYRLAVELVLIAVIRREIVGTASRLRFGTRGILVGHREPTLSGDMRAAASTARPLQFTTAGVS